MAMVCDVTVTMHAANTHPQRLGGLILCLLGRNFVGFIHYFKVLYIYLDELGCKIILELNQYWWSEGG
jgi:hypothetical protein